jgi:predicted metalloprotease
MQYDDDAQLDTSVVEDARSGGGGGFGVGGLGLGTLAAGGGGLGIVGVIVVVLLNVLGGGGSSGLPGDLTGLSGVGSSGVTSVDNAQLAESCRTGKDANTRTDCALVADIESIEDYWRTELPALGASYSHAPTRFFRGQTPSGCGVADTGVGPFYCPSDDRVYIDLSFFDELHDQFGATGGAFVNAYVLAHEYGHHVQDLLGVESRINHSATGPTSDSVRLELQADCYAGVWAHAATTTPDPSSGRPLISSISSADIAAALDAAGRIGDDWIQTHLGSGQVDQNTFTHGTSAERERWFSTGYSTGSPARCDTFSAGNL